MRVLLVHQLYEMRGGAARVLFGLEDALRAGGHRVGVVAAETLDRAEPQGGTMFFGVSAFTRGDFERASAGTRLRWAMNGVYSRAARDAVRSAVARFQPDVAIVLKPEYQLSMAVLSELARLQIPVVQWLVDFKPWCTQGQFYNVKQQSVCTRCAGGLHAAAVKYRCDRDSLALSTYGAIARTVTTSILRLPFKADLYVVPGAANKRMLCEVTSIPAARVVVIPHPMRVSAFQPGSGSGPGNLLFFGGIGPQKGLWTLVRALALLPGQELDVAGVDDYGLSGEFMRYAERLGVADRIHLDTETRMGSALQDRIRNARLVLVPSDWADTLEYALLESMALGKAVVVSDGGANGEFVTHGVDGLVFKRGRHEDLAETIAAALAQPELLATIGRHARTTVEERLAREEFLSSLIAALERARAETG